MKGFFERHCPGETSRRRQPASFPGLRDQLQEVLKPEYRYRPCAALPGEDNRNLSASLRVTLGLFEPTAYGDSAPVSAFDNEAISLQVRRTLRVVGAKVAADSKKPGDLALKAGSDITLTLPHYLSLIHISEPTRLGMIS